MVNIEKGRMVNMENRGESDNRKRRTKVKGGMTRKKNVSEEGSNGNRCRVLCLSLIHI